MALVLKDRVKESSSSSGTGSITLGGVVTGYQTFNAAIANGSTVYYCIHNLAAGYDTEWEVGLGTFTAPTTLARTTILSSSTGSAVNFTAGAGGLEVFVTQPAEQALYTNQVTGLVESSGNGANSISFTAVTSNLFTGNASALTTINASNISSGTIANARTTGSDSNGASTIVLRDVNGSFAGNVITGTTGTFTNISGNGVALTAINASNISSGTIANARTTGSDSNGASTIVLRDSNGSFAGNVITGTTGTFTSVSGNGVALTAINASNISSGTVANARTTASSSNGASTIVLRGTSGEFAAGIITADGSALTAINASSISTGTLANARTTASASNGASTIVTRDASGNFAAAAITATTFSGSGASLTSIPNSATTASSSNGASTIVTRDASGNFTANIGTFTTVAGTLSTAAQTTITSTGNLTNLVATSFGCGTAASGTAGEIRATNNVTAYYSDDRMKTRLGKIDGALNKLKTLDGFYYEANELAQSMGYEVKKEVGVSAQQVQAIMPEVVAPAPIDDKYLTVRYERLVPLLIEAIKELEAQVAELKAR